MKISGCVITKNEEINIENCINNLKQVVDEVIVVDTGSEDRTIRIAKELGASVYEQKWENDFSKARNAALDRAAGDWIIFLDADEFFNEESIPRIRSAIETAHSNPNIEGIFCKLININLETRKDLDTGHVIRIFRNKRQLRFVNKIHEEICNNGRSLNTIDESDAITVIHTGYSSSLRISKARRNLQMLLDNKDHERAAYYLATTYFTLHDFNNAYHYADLALSDKSVLECDHLAYKMHFIKIIIAMTLESSDKEKIESLICKANEKYGEHPEIAKIEAVYRFQEKCYTKSLDKYRYALACQDRYGKQLVQNNFGESVHEVYFYIAQISYLMNREADALSYYVKTLQLNKRNQDAFRGMFLLCRTMPVNDLVALINSIYNVDDEDDIKFVIAQIADCGLSRIVLYYANKWNNTFAHEDDVLIYAYLAQGRYESALEVALLYMQYDYNAFAALVTAILIMGKLYTEAEKIKEEIGIDYYELTMCYQKSVLYSGDASLFLSVYSKIIKHADQNTIQEYIGIGNLHEINLVKGIAEIHMSISQFTQAVHYYKLLFDLQHDDQRKATTAFQIGYCCYKLKQYRESVNWFEEAIMNGYIENDAFEFLRWIADQESDKDIKAKAADLSGANAQSAH